MPRAKKKSPKKARVARSRARGADGLFLSADGHLKSTGRYVGVSSFIQETTTAAYARLSALHDHKLQLDVKKIELGQKKSFRELEQKQTGLAVEQHLLEEKGRQALREAEERAAKERTEAEQRAEENLRAQKIRAVEQHERLAEQQIDREKKLAEEQIRSTEAWVKTLTSDPVS